MKLMDKNIDIDTLRNKFKELSPFYKNLGWVCDKNFLNEKDEQANLIK